MARWWKTLSPYIRDNDGHLLPPELQAAAPHIAGEASIGSIRLTMCWQRALWQPQLAR